MLVDISYVGEEAIHITYFVDEFKISRDYAVALSIMANFSAEFELEPELEVEDFEEILSQIEKTGKSKFVVQIDEEGIEIEPID